MQEVADQLMTGLALPMLAVVGVLVVVVIIIYLFFGHGLDMIKNPKEWRNAGSSGERIVYLDLIRKFHIQENQIFRNVYIPTQNGKTSEIDLIVVSKKGIFVFECKNYGGNIYGDAKRPKWIQYIGKEKHYFYSPLLQNKNHAKHLREFLAKDNIDVPIIPCITMISRGKWKVKNLSSDDYVLGYNCRLKDVYNRLPDSTATVKSFTTILKKLAPLSRPDAAVREKHIEDINKTYHR